jgi:hypothetical protein
MGEIRFTVQAVKRIAKIRKYEGRITYLPAPVAFGQQGEARCAYYNCETCAQHVTAFNQRRQQQHNQQQQETSQRLERSHLQGESIQGKGKGEEGRGRSEIHDKAEEIITPEFGSEEVLPGWVVESGRFLLVCLSNVPDIGTNFSSSSFFFPPDFPLISSSFLALLLLLPLPLTASTLRSEYYDYTLRPHRRWHHGFGVC